MIFSSICGARFTTSYTRIGGVANDIDDDTLKKIRDWAEQFPAQLKYFEKLVHRNRIFVDRIAGIKSSHQPREQSGLALPADLRGSGVPRDLRRDNPYLVYDQLDFDVITFPEGDVWARYMVRRRR